MTEFLHMSCTFYLRMHRSCLSQACLSCAANHGTGPPSGIPSGLALESLPVPAPHGAWSRTDWWARSNHVPPTPSTYHHRRGSCHWGRHGNGHPSSHWSAERIDQQSHRNQYLNLPGLVRIGSKHGTYDLELEDQDTPSSHLIIGVQGRIQDSEGGVSYIQKGGGGGFVQEFQEWIQIVAGSWANQQAKKNCRQP